MLLLFFLGNVLLKDTYFSDSLGAFLIFMFILVIVVGAAGGLFSATQIIRRRRNTSYWLTNRHAIIMMKQGGRNDYTTMVIDLAATDAVKMIERGDGSGTLIFGRNAVNTFSPATRGYISNEADYSFSNIPNVEEVYRMVQDAQAGARQK